MLERRRGVNHYGESNMKGEHVPVPIIRNVQKVLLCKTRMLKYCLSINWSHWPVESETKAPAIVVCYKEVCCQ